MAEVASQALIGPRKYLQGRGVIGSLGEHVADLGKDALVVADENVWGSWAPRWRAPSRAPRCA